MQACILSFRDSAQNVCCNLCLRWTLTDCSHKLSVTKVHVMWLHSQTSCSKLFMILGFSRCAVHFFLTCNLQMTCAKAGLHDKAQLSANLHSVSNVEVRGACRQACEHRANAKGGKATGQVPINVVIGCCSRVSIHRTWSHSQQNNQNHA